jgi:hypothetical protein
MAQGQLYEVRWRKHCSERNAHSLLVHHYHVVLHASPQASMECLHRASAAQLLQGYMAQ